MGRRFPFVSPAFPPTIINPNKGIREIPNHGNVDAEKRKGSSNAAQYDVAYTKHRGDFHRTVKTS